MALSRRRRVQPPAAISPASVPTPHPPAALTGPGRVVAHLTALVVVLVVVVVLVNLGLDTATALGTALAGGYVADDLARRLV